MKKIRAVLLALSLAALCILAACSSTSAGANAAITLNGDSITVSGSGATVSGSTVTVTSAGTYQVSGTLTDGQLVVNTDGAVTLLLSGAEITNTEDDAIHVKSGTVTIALADGTENTVTSGTADSTAAATENISSATQAEETAGNSQSTSTDAKKSADSSTDSSTNDTDDASGAAIFSKDALTLSGAGTLTVNGYINNGIAGKTGVSISSGTITVTSTNDGIKSSEGSIIISDGAITVTAGGDGISAETDLTISGGTYDITSGDGSEASNAGGMQMPGNRNSMTPPDSSQTTDTASPAATTTTTAGTMPGGSSNQGGEGMPGGDASDDTDDSASMKGIKAGSSLTISGGTFTLNSTDHAIHCTGTIDITGGTFNVASSAGKGISGHGNVTIDGEATSITITQSTEGIESKAILTVNNGTINVTSSDDGFNAGGGSTGFGQTRTDTTDSGTHEITINGGSITVDAAGDGLDSNGDLTVNGGTVIVNGPTSNGDGALDSGAESGGKCSVTGGTVIALGSSGMAEGFDTNSTQHSFMYNFSSTISAGTVVTITDASGSKIYSYTSTKDFSSIVFSSADLKEGETYTITAGDQTATVTLSAIAVNSVSTGMGGGMGGTQTAPTGGSFNPGQTQGGKGGGGRPGQPGTGTATATQSASQTA